MEHSPELNALAEALAKAQGAIKPAIRDSANPFFKSKYADLASVSEACREALSSNGLSVVQGTQAGNGETINLDTVLLHSSGQWIASTLTMVPVKADPQGIGSCITYARRYALASMCGVAPDDDDGNAASGISKGTAEVLEEARRRREEAGSRYIRAKVEVKDAGTGEHSREAAQGRGLESGTAEPSRSDLGQGRKDRQGTEVLD